MGRGEPQPLRTSWIFPTSLTYELDVTVQHRKDGKVAVVVGKVTDDKRLYDVPKAAVFFLVVCKLQIASWWSMIVGRFPTQ